MIKSISIADSASFGSSSQVLNPLKRVNFVFGANGSGKTTISRIIANESEYPTCRISWANGRGLQAYVYNSDFAERTLHPDKELAGVFTLGENNVEIEEHINQLKGKLSDLESTKKGLNNTLQGDDGNEGKIGELAALDIEFQEKCWRIKKKFGNQFNEAFTGAVRSKGNFTERLLQKSLKTMPESKPIEELKETATTVFGQEPTIEVPLPQLDTIEILTHEKNPVLTKNVLGKEDVDIAAMIQHLGNSDWVRQGRPFFDANEGRCPFCQQQVPDSLSKSLEDYFDESFVADMNAIASLEKAYQKDVSTLQVAIETLLESGCLFLEIELLKTKKNLLENQIELNLRHLEEKRKEPSRSVELVALSPVLTEISSLLAITNAKVKEHNELVGNLETEKANLINQIWRYILDNEIASDLRVYKKRRSGIECAIEKLRQQIESKKQEIRNRQTDISLLEKQVTSIQPTVDAMNEMLTAFGFSGFQLEAAPKRSAYKLVRSDGTDAKKQLSEGEKTFVAFLYFYHTLNGSETQSGTTHDRMVVFDDPISSLDSDILFIVGTLIKEVFDQARSENSNLKQVFVMTHNVYFHKEVTFSKKRSNANALSDETFWIVRKKFGKSMLEKHSSNPVRTSYQMLWEEIQRHDRSILTIQNTIRRILENYFRILGEIDPNYISSQFTGRERIICKSLFSWVNNGSHFTLDDAFVTGDSGEIEVYLSVFRNIFVKLGHGAHYQMMMKDRDYSQVPTANAR